MPKSEKPKTPKAEKVKHNQKVTSEDVPGSGLAKKAAKGVEAYRRRQKKAMGDL